MNAKQKIGLTGSITVIVGCFLPFVTFPMVGSASLVINVDGTLFETGVFVVFFAFLGMLGALRGKGSVLVFLSCVLAAWEFAARIFHIVDLMSPSEDAGVVDVMLGATVEFGVGAAAILTGLLLMFVSVLMRYPAESRNRYSAKKDTDGEQTNASLERVDAVTGNRADALTDEIKCERDLSLDQYKVYLVKKYSIDKNEALGKIICNERLFATIEEALVYADSIYQMELEHRAEAASRRETMLAQEVQQFDTDDGSHSVAIFTALCALFFLVIVVII